MILQQVVDFTIRSVCMRETILFLYIGGTELKELILRPDPEWHVLSHSNSSCSLFCLFFKPKCPFEPPKGYYISSASQICTFIYIQYSQSKQFCIGAVWKYWVHFFSHLFHFPLFQIPPSRRIPFFYLLSVWENVKPARDKLVFMLLLPAYHSLSSCEPKTKDLCTLTER